MANVFAYRPNRSIAGVSPQDAGQELERIRSEQGELTPANVLEAAADEGSPLHAAFEWDDTAAAHEHRLSQASRLIVSIRVINSPIQQALIPAFVSVRTPERGRQYVPTVEAMSDEQLRARVLLEVRQFIESLERKYAHFEEVVEVLQRMRSQAG